MKNSKNNNRTMILGVLLVGLLIVAYKVMFVAPVEDFGIDDENTLASQRVETLLVKVESINFDNANFVNDPKFLSLQSIDRPLISLPYGKKNPFAAVLGAK